MQCFCVMQFAWECSRGLDCHRSVPWRRPKQEMLRSLKRLSGGDETVDAGTVACADYPVHTEGGLAHAQKRSFKEQQRASASFSY